MTKVPLLGKALVFILEDLDLSTFTHKTWPFTQVTEGLCTY